MMLDMGGAIGIAGGGVESGEWVVGGGGGGVCVTCGGSLQVVRRSCGPRRGRRM